MKFSTVAAILALAACGMLLTGFQCGSAELTSAKLYLQNKDFASAERALQKEVDKNPNNTEAWYLLGQSRLQLGNFAGAMDAMNSALKTPGEKEYETRINDSRRYAWSQSLNAGVGCYNRSVGAPKDSVASLLKCAVDNYRVAISILPDSVVSYRNLAVAQRAAGDGAGEIATLKEGISHGRSADLYLQLINAYLQKAQTAEAKGSKQEAAASYADALTAVGEARKLQPDDAELLGMLIDLYVRLGRASEAKPFINEAIAKDPGNKIYQYNMGVLLMQEDTVTHTDSLVDAIRHFEAALSIDPTYAVAVQNIAVAHMKLGDRIKKENQDAGGKKETDKSYLDHFKKASEYFQQLINLNDANKANPDYWDYLASAYANAGMVKKAEEAIKTADGLRKK